MQPDNLIALTITFTLLFMQQTNGKTYNIEIHQDHSICKVDEKFLSVAIGTYHARQRFKAIDFTSQRLKNVVSALRPAYLRFGGSDSNFLIFRPGSRLVQPTLITTVTTPATTPTTIPTTTQATTTRPTEATTTERATTTEEATTTKERTRTTETPTTTEAPTPTTKTTTTELPTTLPTTPRPTAAPIITSMPSTPAMTAPQQPVTPPPAVPVTTPPQAELPNVNVGDPAQPPGSVPPWGLKNAELERSEKEEDRSKGDSERDDKNERQDKEYQKNGKYFAEDIKQSLDAKQNIETYPAQESPNQNTDNSYSSASMAQPASPASHSSSPSEIASPLPAASQSTSDAGAQQYIGQGSQETVPTESQQQQSPEQRTQQATARLTNVFSREEAEEEGLDRVHQEDNGNSAKRMATIFSKSIPYKRIKRSTEQTAEKRSRHERFPFWFAADDLDRLAHFTHDTGLSLIFDLNGFFRRADGSWDATNAIDIVRHVKDENYNVAWEIGNEPNRYFSYGKQRALTARQVAQDTIKMRSLLMRSKGYGSLLLGPGLSRPGIGSAETFLKDFLDAAAWAIDAVTWHQYSLGKHATLDDFTNPRTFDIFKQQINNINKIVRKTNTNKPVWLGETGSAWGGGITGVSDTFAASFLFLDKLGLAGFYCNQVVIRQSLIGGSYALLDDDFTPRPDYWVAVLHKKLVGRKVFAVSGSDKRVRVYAHCTRAKAGYPEGAITIMAMNLWKNTNVKLKLKGLIGHRAIDEYLVTSTNGKLKSKNVDLNGDELHLSSGIYVPRLHPVQSKTPLKLPPLSYAFYVVPLASARECM